MTQKKQYEQMAVKLYRSTNMAVLSTISKRYDGYPFGSFITFISGCNRDAYIYISNLAQHTKNIENNPKACITIISNDDEDDKNILNNDTSEDEIPNNENILNNDTSEDEILNNENILNNDTSDDENKVEVLNDNSSDDENEVEVLNDNSSDDENEVEVLNDNSSDDE